MKFLRATIETLPHRLSDELLKTTPIKNINLKKFEINLQKDWNLLSQTSELANQVIIQRFFALFCFVLTFALFFGMPSFHISTNDTKYCKHGIDLLLLCDIGALQVEGPHEVRICSLQVVSDYSLFVVGHFRSFVVKGRSLHVVSCSLQVVPGCFRSFLAPCRSFQVIFCSLQVVSGCFLLVSGRFSSFRVVPRFSKDVIFFVLAIIHFSNVYFVMDDFCFSFRSNLRNQ